MQPRDARFALRSKLLPATLRAAAENVRGYGERWGTLDERVVGLRDLRHLPIITKEDMLQEPNDYLDTKLPTERLQHTGGTTGRTLFIHRSKPELEFISAFYSRLQGLMANGLNDDDLPGAPCIVAMGRYHGEPTPIPYFGKVDLVDFTEPLAPSNLEHIFTYSADRPKRDALFLGLESQVRIATCMLVEADFDFRRSRVRAVITTGDFIPARLLDWLGRTWGTPIHSRYSMSEIFGGASLCAECGYFHLDPHVIGEVVDPLSMTLANGEVGVLALTCLYPFIQKQPMIRYFTGDLVTLGPNNCPIDAFGFAFLGRLSRSIIRKRQQQLELLVSGAKLYDILDRYSDINTTEMFPKVVGVKDRTALGHVKASLQAHEAHGVTVIELRPEFRYSVYMYSERVRHVVAEIRKQLLDNHPDLTKGVLEGSTRLRIVPSNPGQERSFQIDEVE